MVSQSPHVPYSFSVALQNHLQTLARKGTKGGQDVPRMTYRTGGSRYTQVFLLSVTVLSVQDYCEWPV